MDNSALILMIFGGAIANLLIIYLLIKSAINNSETGLHAKIQTNLLALIAKKSGATDNEINDCYKDYS